MLLTPSLGRRRPVAPCRVAAVSEDGFTLVELLIVITIIAVLAGLLFPVMSGLQDRARTTQVKNEELQIVNAINAFFTEYGRYPCDPQPGGDDQDFFATDDNANNVLFDVLRGDPNNGNVQTFNPRAIAFLQPPIAKDLTRPKAGIGGNGRYYDLWGSCYRVRMDNNYSGAVPNPYSQNAGFDPIQLGVIVWSLGKNQTGATTARAGGDKKSAASADDIISWQ